MTTQPSQLDIRDGTDERELLLCGVVDSHTAPTLQRHLGELDVTADIVVGVTDVEFIDSSGLRVIIAAHTTLEEAGHRLVLSGRSEPVDRLLEITGLADHLHRA